MEDSTHYTPVHRHTEGPHSVSPRSVQPLILHSPCPRDQTHISPVPTPLFHSLQAVVSLLPVKVLPTRMHFGTTTIIYSVCVYMCIYAVCCILLLLLLLYYDCQQRDGIMKQQRPCIGTRLHSKKILLIVQDLMTAKVTGEDTTAWRE